MLATPRDLEDFARGFSLTEGIVSRADELEVRGIHERLAGLEIDCAIPEERAARLDTTRTLEGRTGCGLCGVRDLEHAVRWPPAVPRGNVTTSACLHRALDALAAGQQLNELTGAVHAAAWADHAGHIELVREDVGRHNALDKLVGALAAAGTDFSRGMMIVTSRASYEMVQKAATAGVTILCAISAPTTLAVKMAESAGLTLIGFARRDSHVAYTHLWRLSDADCNGAQRA
jgi:FdhD protein